MTKKTDKKNSVFALEAANKPAPQSGIKKIRNRLRRTVKQRSKKTGTPARLFEAPSLRATCHFTDRMQGYGLKPLQANELKSIYALFAWVANEQGAAEETVQSMTEVRFCVKDVNGLRQRDYDEVIKFLVDLRIDEMRH